MKELKIYLLVLVAGAIGAANVLYSAHPKEVMKEDEQVREQVARQRRLREFQEVREEEDAAERKKKGVLPAQLEIEEGAAAAVQSLGGPGEEEELQQAIAMSFEPQEKQAGTKKTAKSQEEKKEEDEKRAEDMQTYRKNLAEAEREQAEARARRGGRPVEYSRADVTKLVGEVPTAVSKHMKPFVFKEASFLDTNVTVETNFVGLVQRLSGEPAVIKDNKFILSTGPDIEKIYVWDIGTRNFIRTFGHGQNSGYHISNLAISNDGKRLVTSSGELHVWDTESYRLLRTFSLRNFFTVAHEYVTATAINDDGSVIAVGTSTGNIHVLNVDTGTLLQSFSTDKNDQIGCVAMNQEGSHVIASQRNDVYMWDVPTGTLVQKFVGHKQYVTSVIIGFEQDLIITGSWDHTVRVWNGKTGAVVRILDVKGLINSVTLGAHNELIVIGCDQGEIYIWDGISSSPQRKLNGPGKIRSVTMSNDGKWIVASVEVRGNTRIYTITLKEPQEVKLVPYARRALFIDEAAKLRDRATGIPHFPKNRLQAIHKGIALLKSAGISRKDFESYLGNIERRIKQEFAQGLQETIEYLKSVRDRANRTQDFPDELRQAIHERVERLLKDDQSQPDFAMKVNEAVQDVERLLEEGLEEIRRQNLLAPPFGF